MPGSGKGAVAIALAIGLATGLLATAAVAADVRTGQPLFHIERSKNAKIVQYDVLAEAGRRPDPDRPVAAYWVKPSGKRKPLKWFQRRAYGFDARCLRGCETIEIEMEADVGRSIRARRVDGRYRAETTIDGRPAYLDRAFVQSDESGFLPRVMYVEFFGVDVETGEPRYERYLPDS